MEIIIGGITYKRDKSNRIRFEGVQRGLRGQVVGRCKGWLKDRYGEPVVYSGVSQSEFEYRVKAAIWYQ